MYSTCKGREIAEKILHSIEDEAADIVRKSIGCVLVGVDSATDACRGYY